MIFRLDVLVWSFAVVGAIEKGDASSEELALIRGIRFKPDEERASDKLLHPSNLKGSSLWQSAIQLFGGKLDLSSVWIAYNS